MGCGASSAAPPASGDAPPARAPTAATPTPTATPTATPTSAPAPKPAPASGGFLGLDKDGDGKVSMAELTVNEKSEAEKMFAQFDKNGDGKLSMKEGKEAIKAIFDQQGSALVSFDAIWSAYDKDGSFFLSLEEFAVMHGALFHGKFQSDDLMRKAAKRPVSA